MATTAKILQHVTPRLDALLNVASFTKVHFAYVAKYMRAIDPPLHLLMRKAFGTILDAFAKCGTERAKLRDLRIVITKGAHMPGDEAPEIVANLRPDGTMDCEDAPDEIDRWFPQPIENTKHVEYPPLPQVHGTAEICELAGMLYDNIEQIESELRWLITELLVSHRWDQALRPQNPNYPHLRAAAITGFGTVPRGAEPAHMIADAAKVKKSSDVVIKWLQSRTRSNQFVFTCMQSIMSEKTRPELVEIIERMKDATLQAERIKSDIAPAWGLHPVTEWMHSAEFFAMMKWPADADIDNARGQYGVVLCSRGYGANITTSWYEAMKPNKHNEGLSKPFMRKMNTVTVGVPNESERGYEIYGKDEQHWLFIEIITHGDETFMRQYGAISSVLQRSEVAFALDGMSTRAYQYAKTVHTMPMLRDHAFFVTQYLGEKPPVAASERIQVDVRAHITAELPKITKWEDFTTWLHQDAFQKIIQTACTRALKPDVLQIDSMCTHVAHVYWCSRELTKQIIAIEPREKVPDNMFTDALASASVKEIIVRACEKVDETIGWVREKPFTEYLREHSSVMS